MYVCDSLSVYKGVSQFANCKIENRGFLKAGSQVKSGARQGVGPGGEQSQVGSGARGGSGAWQGAKPGGDWSQVGTEARRTA